MALPDIDIHLLRCLEMLVRESHVTRAADRMGMSQSGMSTALARLRTLFNDPILVRTPQGMKPSEHAPEIVGAVRRALKEIDRAMARRGPFEPASASAVFTVMASDYVGMTVLPPLIERLRKEAPNITLTIATPQPSRIREVLANGEADLVVGFYHDISEGLYQTVVLHDRLACIARAGHPLIRGRMTPALYSACGHIFYGAPPAFVSSLEVLMEQSLRAHGIERHVWVNIPSMAMMPGVVAQTDLLATMPWRMGQSVAQGLALQVLPLPFELEPLPVHAIWHASMHDNNAHLWLRGLVQQIGRSL
jgi:DNA-binding transcriptional LysR family regulator